VRAALLIVLAAAGHADHGLLIKLESKGPVLYRQERVGQNGKTFMVTKFRSMRTDAEKDGKPRWATANDRPRDAGRAIIRKLRIDELPQLFNVLKGDMSLVGPRPERPFFVEQLTQQIPYFAVRHSVKPGVTGWAQVRYQYGVHGRGLAGEAAVRPVLRQEPLAVPRPRHPVRDGGVVLTGKGAR
jgi:lipopolysaccharide/colanic/teichoic acid biosynthesis glycosyltransferase